MSEMEILKRFRKNTRGEMQKIISIVIALFVAGVMLPVALTSIASGNYSGVDPAVKTIVTVLLPILAVIAIIYVFIRKR